jgi:hypothetical protein
MEEKHAQNGHKLTALEEEVLTKRVLGADKWGFSIRPEVLRGMAQILLSECTRDPTATIGAVRDPVLSFRATANGLNN